MLILGTFSLSPDFTKYIQEDFYNADVSYLDVEINSTLPLYEVDIYKT